MDISTDVYLSSRYCNSALKKSILGDPLSDVFCRAVPAEIRRGAPTMLPFWRRKVCYIRYVCFVLLIFYHKEWLEVEITQVRHILEVRFVVEVLISDIKECPAQGPA